MIYQYEALNRKGERVSDIIDSTNETKAKQKLKSEGLYVVKIAPKTTVEAEAEVKSQKSLLGGIASSITKLNARRASAKQIGIFSRQLSTLLNAGMPLLRAINDILDQTDNQYFKQVIADIKDNLESGASFSNCLQKHKGVFSEMYINMVRVGENLGSLDSVIERLADIEEKNTMLKSKVQSALWYPMFLIVVSIGIVIFLMVKIIPSLSEMFVEMGKELPLPTKIVMGVSSFLTRYILFLAIAVIALLYMFNRYIHTEKGKRHFDEIKMKIPVIKTFYNKLIVLNFTQNMGIMLTNQVDILRSFEIVKKIVNNIIIEEKITEASHKIREGMGVSKALQGAGFLPKMVLGMIAAGEQSDSLDEMLVKIGKVYENEIDLAITSMMSLIEPVIILFMGGVVGTIVVSVIMPILEMNLSVQ